MFRSMTPKGRTSLAIVFSAVLVTPLVFWAMNDWSLSSMDASGLAIVAALTFSVALGAFVSGRVFASGFGASGLSGAAGSFFAGAAVLFGSAFIGGAVFGAFVFLDAAGAGRSGVGALEAIAVMSFAGLSAAIGVIAEAPETLGFMLAAVVFAHLVGRAQHAPRKDEAA